MKSARSGPLSCGKESAVAERGVSDVWFAWFWRWPGWRVSMKIAQFGVRIGEPGARFMVRRPLSWAVRGGVSPPEGHDVTADDDLLAEQVHYFCRRAGEYDVTAY